MFKAAGTTFHSSLSPNFAPEEICPERLNQYAYWPSELLYQYRFFSAHSYMAELQYIPRPIKLVTMLREPRARLLSQYRYLSALSDGEIRERGIPSALYPQTAGLGSWLDSGRSRVTHSYWNLQTMFLAGDPFFSPSGAIWRDDQEILEAAINNLDHLSAFGIAEMFEDSLDHICKVLDLRHFYDGTPLNVTSKAAEDLHGELRGETDQTLELFEDAIKLDDFLYKYALAKFKTSVPDAKQRFNKFFSMQAF
jgi:hypothetical protein